MKKIEAIIRPEKLDAVRACLTEAGYPGITISEAQGHGLQKGIYNKWRGSEYHVELLQKIKIEIVALDEEVDAITQAILESAFTGGMGDGKIFITEVCEAVRIRTRERGDQAIL